MAKKIQNRSYSPYDASHLGGFLGGGVTGITAAILGTRGLIKAARIESHAGRYSIQSVFYRDIGRPISRIVFDSLASRDFLRFLPKLRSLTVLGGVAGGAIGLG
ncbi:MAG: hypothetical protein Q7S68_03775, partial [Deltaproteobacteria bacterium]|nr:hypothetical protein [Deltaproteobacteria bacterium]